MTQTDKIAEICARHRHREGPLLPILHDVQAELGHVDSSAETAIAAELNLSRADVHGVVSFYHDFRTAPDARPEVQICRAEACKARGVEALIRDTETTAGNRVRLSTVYCLGLCSVGPNARVGNTLHARLDAPKLCQIVQQA